MAKRIYKYRLHIGVTRLELPNSSQVLSVQMQGGNLEMWVLLDPEIPKILPRTFTVFNTGEILNNNQMGYLATVQDGALVYHVFEILK